MSTTVTIKPGSADGEDTFIDEANPSTNYSALTYLKTDAPSPDTKQALILFDISQIPLRATILSAKLGLYATVVSGDPKIKINQAISPWIASTVTWDTAPYPGAFSVSVDLVEDVYVEADVTEMVQQWVNEEKQNYGFHICATLCDEVAHQFGSSRAAASTHRPYLTVTFSSPLLYLSPGGDGHIFFDLDNYVVKTATTWGIQKDTSAMYSCAVWSNCGLNNYVTFNAILVPGTYQLNVIYIKTSDSGKVRYYIDPATDAIGTNTNKVLEQDQRAAVAAWGNKTKVSGITITEAGLYRLKLLVYDTSGASYAMYIESLSLTRTA